MTEQELLAEVLARADRAGVLAYHCYDSRPVTDKGFPDLVLAGINMAMFVELKSATGALSPSQVAWRYRLLGAGMWYAVWRPQHLRNGEVDQVLAALA